MTAKVSQTPAFWLPATAEDAVKLINEPGISWEERKRRKAQYFAIVHSTKGRDREIVRNLSQSKTGKKDV